MKKHCVNSAAWRQSTNGWYLATSWNLSPKKPTLRFHCFSHLNLVICRSDVQTSGRGDCWRTVTTPQVPKELNYIGNYENYETITNMKITKLSAQFFFRIFYPLVVSTCPGVTLPGKTLSYHRGLVLSNLWLAISLLPASNIFFKVGFTVAERVMCIPSMASSAILARFIAQVVDSSKRRVAGIYLAVLLVLVVWSRSCVEYSKTWWIAERLYRSAVYRSKIAWWNSATLEPSHSIAPLFWSLKM